MLQWFLSVTVVLRDMRKKAMDALAHLGESDSATAQVVNGYLKTDYQNLYRLWEDGGFDTRELGNLGRHIHFGEEHDYHDILKRDLPSVESCAEEHVREGVPIEPKVGFEDLLHPVIFEHAFQHYRNGHYREAVLNSIVAVYDLLRERTGLQLDGQSLATEAFSLEKPYLVFSELSTESGRNDQKGFLQVLAGAYIGIRNPKAHSLHHDLDESKAAQYLVFASLLARRVWEAHAP